MHKFKLKKDKIHDVYVSMEISHSVCHVTTRPSLHSRSRAVFNIHRGRDEFKAKLACGIRIVLHNVE